MNNKPLLLVIDDEVVILNMLKDSLEDEGYRVETLSEGNMALDLIGKLVPDIVLLDVFMPNCNGIKLLERIKKEYPHQKVVIISGFGNIPIAIKAVKKGALDFIEKPLNLDEILEKISFLKKSGESESSKLLESEDGLERYGIIGQSYLFLELLNQVKLVAGLGLPITIYGQHGTGKSLIANYVYELSKNDGDSFFVLDSSALSDQGFDDFAKKIVSEQGVFLFVKNINNLSSSLQKNLLDLLNKKIDMRFLCSSTVPLFDLLTSGKFNSCLYHKLNVLPLEIPPLNKRRYDVPLLCDFFMHTFNKKYSKSLVLSTRSIRLLRNHNWIGNVSQLKLLIEKVVSSISDSVQVIYPDLLEECLAEKDIQLLEEQTFSWFNSLDEASKAFEKRFIVYLLKKSGFDIKQVSDRLNLTDLQLRDKILEFNIKFKD